MAMIACAALDALGILVQLLRRFSPSMYPQMDSTMNDLVPTWNLITSSQQAHAIITLLLKFVLCYVNELKHKYCSLMSVCKIQFLTIVQVLFSTLLDEAALLCTSCIKSITFLHNLFFLTTFVLGKEGGQVNQTSAVRKNEN